MQIFPFHTLVFFFSRIVIVILWLIGNKTSCRPIPSVCNHTRDKQIGLPLRGRASMITDRTSMITDRRNRTPHSPITITYR